MNWSPDTRWKYVLDISSGIKRCGEDNENGCGCLQPFKIKKEGLATIFAHWKNDAEEDEDGEEGHEDAHVLVLGDEERGRALGDGVHEVGGLLDDLSKTRLGGGASFREKRGEKRRG